MLHARSYEQPFDGDLQLDIFQEVRRLWPGILLFNGGVYTPEKAKEVLAATKADGLGIARGAWGKPWLFSQIKQYLTTGTYDSPTWEAIKQVMLRHAQLALAHKNDYGLIELRKHLGWYTKGRPNASDLRAKLVRVSALDELTAILANA
ncbi:MAG: tRNA-dihydrouridine synthase [Candidatus Kerfeldbacteria bacterium]|nr:tRNA-dihydrouridine synthase [Candidatus Kerfeldbacteria bacterium]